MVSDQACCNILLALKPNIANVSNIAVTNIVSHKLPCCYSDIRVTVDYRPPLTLELPSLVY